MDEIKQKIIQSLDSIVGDEKRAYKDGLATGMLLSALFLGLLYIIINF